MNALRWFPGDPRKGIWNLSSAAVAGFCWNKQPEESEIYGRKRSSGVDPGQNGIARAEWATCAWGGSLTAAPLLINPRIVPFAEQTTKAGEATRDSFVLQSSLIYSIWCQEQFFDFRPLYLGRFGWRNVKSEETEGRRKKSETIVWFLKRLNAVWFGFQTWRFSNRKCQLIRAIAWHRMMIAVIPAGGAPAVARGGETAQFDMNVSISFLRRDSLVG